MRRPTPESFFAVSWLDAKEQERRDDERIALISKLALGFSALAAVGAAVVMVLS